MTLHDLSNAVSNTWQVSQQFFESRSGDADQTAIGLGSNTGRSRTVLD